MERRMHPAKVLIKIIMVLHMLTVHVSLADIKYPTTNQKENIRIGSSSDQAFVDEAQNRILIGKCDTKTDPESGAPSNYCDFLSGKEGSIFTRYINFENITKTRVYLSKIIAKDQIIVSVNGHVVYTSTGDKSLSIDYSSKFTDLIVDEPFDHYYGIKVLGKIVPIQTGKTIVVYPGIDLTQYLTNGQNRIEVQLAVGYIGGYQLELKFGGVSDSTKKYDCNDTTHNCSQGKEERIVDGALVTRDCWQTSYAKTCQYHSKNDCGRFINDPNCYFIQEKDCLFKDASGNCVNQLREYSCKSGDEEYEVQRPKFITQNNDSNIPGGLKCSGLPCFDGRCGKNEWDKDADMLNSVSKLNIASHSKGTKDINNISLFPGTSEHCSIKIASSSNCCKIKGEGKEGKLSGGWCHKIGAKCTKDEIELANKRMKNLCIYVGNRVDKKIGIKTLQKKYYCCFSNHLFKEIQVQGRQQLANKGISFSKSSLFGSGDNTSCRGLTLNELQNIDFNKIDFTNVFPEILEKMKMPNASDIQIKHTQRSSI
jgi:conjugal transfer mating pair stabilization protein TraN